MIRILTTTLLCAALLCGQAIAQMRPEQMVTEPWLWTGRQAQPPCAPPTTTGTITLTLNACTNPVNPSVGGSPDHWQFSLTGNGTLAVAANTMAVGQIFWLEVAAGSNTLSLPSPPFIFGPTANTTFAGNSSLVCSVHDLTPTFWCPGGVAANIGGSTRSFVRAGTTSGTTGSLVLTLSASGANSAICATYTSSNATTSGVTDSNGDTFTGFVGFTVGTHELKMWRMMSLPANVTSFTANYSASNAGKLHCDIFSGITGIVVDSGGFNTQNSPASGANNITSTAFTSTAGHLLVGVNFASATTGVSAGTSPIAFTATTPADGTGAAYIISTEYLLSSPGGSVACTFGNSTSDNFYTYCGDFN